MRWLRGSLRYIIWSTTIVLTGLILWACYGPHNTTTRELLILLSIFLLSQVAVELVRSEEHTSELQSLMRISYAVFCLKKKKTNPKLKHQRHHIRNHYTSI